MRSLICLCFLVVFSNHGFAQESMHAAGKNAPQEDSVAALITRLYNDGQYQQAIALMVTADSAARLPRSVFYEGLSYAALYDYPRALELLKFAVGGDSMNVNYRFQYGRLLMQAGFPDEASDELSLCMKIDSSYLPAAYQLGLLYNARKDHPEKEAEIFSFLVRQNSKDFLSLYYLGSALKKVGREDSGMVCIERSAELNPRYFPSQIAIGHDRYGKKDYAAALKSYRRAEALRPRDKDLIYVIGDCLLRLGAHREATECFRKAIALDSSVAYFHAQLGLAYFIMKRFQDCVVAYQKALEIDNENVLYYLKLADAYDKLDSSRGVIDSYQQAIEAMHSEKISYVYKTLADYYAKKKMYRDAAHAYERVFEYNPSNTMALFFAGHFYSLTTDTQSAINALEKHLLALGTDSLNVEARNHVKELIRSIKNPPSSKETQ